MDATAPKLYGVNYVLAGKGPCRKVGRGRALRIGREVGVSNGAHHSTIATRYAKAPCRAAIPR